MTAVSERARLEDEAIAAAFADSPPPSPLPSRATGGPAYDAAPTPVSVEAAEYEREHGYPADAVRQPAGRYTLLVDRWNQLDESAPDGVRPRGNGDVLELSAEEATRLCHLRSAEQVGESERRSLATMAGEVERHRREYERLAAEVAAAGEAQAQAEQDEAAARETAVVRRIAELEAELARLRAPQ